MGSLSAVTAAAVFDMDRTLLSGASGPAISEALVEVGLMSGRRIPGQGLVFRAFDIIGETRPSMILTRQFARMAAGWERTTAQRAGEIAAGPLVGMVPPFALELLNEHREAGREVALATTSPYDLVKPLADRLGIEHVLATRYEESDGHYTGRIRGEFVWGKGKLRAVQAWATANAIDLADSYAYSDSYFDRPLLGAVGHPTAVHPDPRLRALAMLRRWPTQFFDVPPGVPKFAGLEPQQAVMALTQPQVFPYVRFDIAGLDNIPSDGPAIVVANHRSYFDPLAVGFAMARRGRPVRFLGKREVFDAPIVGDVARALGGIAVDRGTGSDEPLERAASVLRAGELVAIMPEGTIPRGEAFFDPVLQGRWGAARLAAKAGVPVIPMGLWGTEKVWPRSSRVPDVTNVLSPPTIRVRAGAPLHVGGEDVEADTGAIMAAIVEQLPPEARVQRTPSSEELARTLPAGYSGDPDGESERRPGED